MISDADLCLSFLRRISKGMRTRGEPAAKMLDAIILCGGRGTRLAGVVKDVPKPLAPVLGKPFLDHLLGFHPDLGFKIFDVGERWDVPEIEE